MEPFAIFLMCAGIVGLYALRFRIGLPTSHTLLPFQSGILYKRGRPAREVGPGRHRVFLGSQKIIFLDIRPIQVKADHRAVALADGVTAVYGFAASAKVRDAKKAIYASATYSQLPAFVTLCVTRGVLGRCSADQIRIGQAALTEQIITACKARLAATGFELLSFRFSELLVAPPV